MTTSANSYRQAPEAMTAPPAGCPVHANWSPFDEDYLADPYPIAARLRNEHPVFFPAPLGHVVGIRMADIEYVFTHPDIYASSNVQDPVYPLAPEARRVLEADDFDPVAVMSNRQEPDHARIRTYTRSGFGNRRLRSLEDYMRGRATVLIDAMVDGGRQPSSSRPSPSRFPPRSCSDCWGSRPRTTP